MLGKEHISRVCYVLYVMCYNTPPWDQVPTILWVSHWPPRHGTDELSSVGHGMLPGETQTTITKHRAQHLSVQSPKKMKTKIDF